MSASGGSDDAADRGESPDAEAQTGRLSGVRGISHDEDERPSREDRDYGHTIFTRKPVALPRWLGGRKKGG